MSPEDEADRVTAQALPSCKLTPEQIRAFIPEQGIKLVDLRKCFGKRVLPNDTKSYWKFDSLVAQLATNRDDMYYLKDPNPEHVDNAIHGDKSTAKAPGHEPWKGALRLVNGRMLTEMARFNSKIAKFCHAVRVRDVDAFTLRPITMTHGPLAGKHAVVLEPITTSFHCIDLPPELRQMVYDLLLKQEDALAISTYNLGREPRKPCLYSFCKRYHRGKNMTWEKLRAENARGPPSEISSVLCINEHVRQETATTAYGHNRFKFDSLADISALILLG